MAEMAIQLRPAWAQVGSRLPVWKTTANTSLRSGSLLTAAHLLRPPAHLTVKKDVKRELCCPAPPRFWPS